MTCNCQTMVAPFLRFTSDNFFSTDVKRGALSWYSVTHGMCSRHALHTCTTSVLTKWEHDMMHYTQNALAMHGHCENGRTPDTISVMSMPLIRADVAIQTTCPLARHVPCLVAVSPPAPSSHRPVTERWQTVPVPSGRPPLMGGLAGPALRAPPPRLGVGPSLLPACSPS